MPRFEATLTSGETIAEVHDAPVPSFRIVQEAERAGALVRFEVVHDDGTRQGVDLITGAVWVGSERIAVERPPAPLRIVYYKQMHADSDGSRPVLDAVTVGWQATVTTDGGKRNIRFGTRCFPSERRFVVTEGI